MSFFTTPPIGTAVADKRIGSPTYGQTIGQVGIGGTVTSTLTSNFGQNIGQVGIGGNVTSTNISTYGNTLGSCR